MSVELRRLLPKLVGEGVPVQPPVTTCCIEGAEECAAVERRKRPHAISITGIKQWPRDRCQHWWPVRQPLSEADSPVTASAFAARLVSAGLRFWGGGCV